MIKTNAEKQKEYRERKKAKEGFKYFEKERARQKKNYTKVKDLSKKDLKVRREAVKLHIEKHCLSAKQLLYTSECSTSLSCLSKSLSTPESPRFLVAMKFPKQGESSKMRKRRSHDRFYKKTKNLEEEKKALEKSSATLRQRVHRMKKKKQKKDTDHLAPHKTVANLLRSGGLSLGILSNLCFLPRWFQKRSELSCLNRKIRRKVSGGW